MFGTFDIDFDQRDLWRIHSDKAVSRVLIGILRSSIMIFRAVITLPLRHGSAASKKECAVVVAQAVMTKVYRSINFVLLHITLEHLIRTTIGSKK